MLDFSKSRLPKRFKHYIDRINKTFKIDLDIIVTREERRVLVEFAKCRTQEDIELLLSGMFNGNQVSSGIRYLRMAISGLNDLWETGDLDQAEGWMRENVYTLLFDRLFLLNKHFKTMRGECYSAVIKELHDMDPKRVDFILRSVNDKSDYTSTEEKASNKSTTIDIQKGRVLQRGMLDTWQKRLLHSSTLASELEAITCQWRGREMLVFGTKLIDDGKFLAYKKASLLIPSDIHHCATASRALMVLLSIMHNTTLNFMRMSIMLNAISELSVKKLEIEDGSCLTDTRLHTSLYLIHYIPSPIFPENN
ncbi:hypothetical protein DM01DRAFT_1362249 [Hesseltinella vesiculosa]|uniref:Uncharacterized protein n=1 Tax=Hesseltinella vesiculosa TaxID=101127 RepID=A0A1X2GPN2_9FUNG|nr:hypothetical protein DM01DRAFT_1362249 [Hesseltinella vesiculosa]